MILKRGYLGDYFGEYYRACTGDTRSLDYGSYVKDGHAKQGSVGRV